MRYTVEMAADGMTHAHSSNIKDITSTISEVVMLAMKKCHTYAIQMDSGGIIHMSNLMTSGKRFE
jgi:hypothetical protein